MSNSAPPTETSEPGDIWYAKHDPDSDPTARIGTPHYQSWLELQPDGDNLVHEFLTKPLLRKEYYSIARSWRESPGSKEFGDRWCRTIEKAIALPPGILKRDDFASFHKYLFWFLATAIYQQTGHPIETFPPHDGPFTAESFHGVPNGDQTGGLNPGGIGVPP